MAEFRKQVVEALTTILRCCACDDVGDFASHQYLRSVIADWKFSLVGSGREGGPRMDVYTPINASDAEIRAAMIAVKREREAAHSNPMEETVYRSENAVPFGGVK